MWRTLLIAVLLTAQTSKAQFFEPADGLHKGRLAGVIITESAGYASSVLLLNYLWYQYNDRTSFHFFNDNAEWLQMDKVGHSMTSYYMGEVGYKTLRWTGLDKKRSLWFGGTLGSFYLLSMEVLDGFADDWGFSVGDIAANTVGTAMFMAQEHYWDEQRIKLKFSVHLSPYATYRPSVLGGNVPERLMKDYNGQTYWLSTSLGSFMKEGSKLPKWINLAVGYSGNDMVSGRPEDNVLYPGQFDRYRQYFVAPDIDFTRIPTKQRWLKPILQALNIFKFPLPALEFSKHGVKGHWLYF